MIIRGGQEAEALAKKARALMEYLGETRAGKYMAGLAGAGTDLAKTYGKVAKKTVRNVLKDLDHLVGLGKTGNKYAAMAESGMARNWNDALSAVARERGEIIFIRPVNPHSKKWIEDGLAVGKGMHVKGKTSDWGPMAGLIPVDQRLSKLGNPETMAKDIEKATEILKRNGVPADEAAERARRLYAMKYENQTHKYGKKVFDSLSSNNAQSKTLIKDGKTVVMVTDEAGKVQVLYRKMDGTYLDADGVTPIPKSALKGAKPEPVQVLSDPQPGKYLAADADTLGIGTPRNPGTIRSGKTMDHAAQGNISDAEWATGYRVNVEARLQGETGGIIQHGPATRFPDKPDFPVTMYLPDGSMGIIRNEKDLQTAFKAAREGGMKGLEPHPNWGWKKDWDK